jgi:putative ATPase
VNLQTIFEASEPLASRMRPRTIEDVVGQGKVLSKGSPLHRLLSGETRGAQSVILWGPPGSGKTSITNVLANIPGRSLVQLSAISAGVKEVREVIDKARTDAIGFGLETVLFLDEIHRFSKAQQDSLLPAVEAGIVTLVAATTENPSFSIISPLISRSLVVQLEPLSDEWLGVLVERALSSDRGMHGLVAISDEARDRLIANAQGDARRVLTFLEALAFAAYQRNPKGNKVTIDTQDFEVALTSAPLRYDRDGDSHYDIISAFIKSVRGSDADAAIYWLARMIEGGEDPRFIARRLMILAAEDIGLADPQALVLATAAAQSVALIGMPEGRIALSEVTIYLALAPKSNTAYNAINSALADVRAGLLSEVPKHLRSSNYAGAEGYGNGVGYDYPHDHTPPVVKQEYLGAKASSKRYYLPKSAGAEEPKVSLWESLRKIIRGK